MQNETRIQWDLTPKQSEAWDYLMSPGINELLFGGGAGGGKTDFGCGFAIHQCLHYPGIRGFLAREVLKDLKDSTLLTFFERALKWGLKEGRDFRYHTDSHITFIKNESTIFLKELKWLPSDPQFDRLGSTEYTFGFIDEAQQIHAKAKNVMRSRIRFLLKRYNLTPKLLMGCNPHKGFLYSEFYKPSKEGKLQENRAFVQALAKDNPHIDPSYIKNLNTLDPNTKERLLFGNWEYDDDPARLMEYEALIDLFTNIVPASSEKYITADIARLGDDKTVIAYWEGWAVKRLAYFNKITTDTTERIINEWRAQHGVSLSHTIVDEDGIGGGVKDHLQCKGFVANTRAFKNENYASLKSQCYYNLARRINKREVSVHCEDQDTREMIISELEQIKAKDADKDRKLQVISKDEMKEHLGRSPDFADTLMMRCAFDYAQVPNIVWV